jgi:hypothetical protein
VFHPRLRVLNFAVRIMAQGSPMGVAGRRATPACGGRPGPRWSLSAACAHAVVVSVLTPAEILIAARRLTGARPHLATVAGIVHPEDLRQLCRDELSVSTSTPVAGISADAGLVGSSRPRRGSESCDAERRSPGG